MKRQAKTVENWSKGHSKEWLEKWMISVKEETGSDTIRFVYGGSEDITAAAVKRLDDIGALKQVGMKIEFVKDILKPPPSIN